MSGLLISNVAELGQALRTVRKQRGLTQHTAAQMCDVSLPFLNALERGKPTAQIGKAIGVCKSFGIVITLTLPEQ